MCYFKEECVNFEYWDYMVFIVVDGDMGFQSMILVMKMVCEFVDVGVVCVYIDDLVIGKLWFDLFIRF